MKKCIKCGVEKTLDCFHKHKGNKYGVNSTCKPCRAASDQVNREHICARQKANYQKHKEENGEYFQARKEKGKARYAANREELLANSKAYYWENKDSKIAIYLENNKEKIEAYTKARYAANKEEMKAAAKRWRKNNPDKAREHDRVRKRKRRAAKRAVNEDYTVEDEKITREAFDHACFNCGSTENLAVDHYRPLSKGNALTLTNAIILCTSCNSSKNNKDPEEFFSEEQTTIIQEVFDRVEEQV